jgi:hypothetical protein
MAKVFDLCMVWPLSCFKHVPYTHSKISSQQCYSTGRGLGPCDKVHVCMCSAAHDDVELKRACSHTHIHNFNDDLCARST